MFPCPACELVVASPTPEPGLPLMGNFEPIITAACTTLARALVFAGEQWAKAVLAVDICMLDRCNGVPPRVIATV